MWTIFGEFEVLKQSEFWTTFFFYWTRFSDALLSPSIVLLSSSPFD